MKLKKFALNGALILAMASSSWSHAGVREVGNGGDGIRIDGNVYILDLVEAGVERDPCFDSGVGEDAEMIRRLSKPLKDSSFPVGLLSRKLSEIKAKEPMISLSLIKAIEIFDWRLVSKTLIDIRDEDGVIDVGPTDLVQLAIRRGASIFIDREAFRALDDRQKVALILHEAVYSLLPPTFVMKDAEGRRLFRQSSPKARAVNGYFFTEALRTDGADEFGRHTRDLSLSSGKDGILEGAGLVSFAPLISLKGGAKPGKKFVGRNASSIDIEQVVLDVCKGLRPYEEVAVSFESWSYEFRIEEFQTPEGTSSYVRTLSDSLGPDVLPLARRRFSSESECVQETRSIVTRERVRFSDYK